jgi:hypothetical protein
VKLQDAYASETNALGTWKVIGYAKPGGTNFDYAENTSTLTVTCVAGKASSDKTKCEKDGDVDPVVGSSTYTEAWSASNKADLNECTKDKNWVISATIGQNNSETTTAGTVSYTSTVKTDECKALTPNFEAIGR